MKIFFYCLREFDELPIVRDYCARFGMEFAYTTEYPSLQNAHLADGCRAVSTTPAPIGEELLTRWYSMGMRYYGTRSIGYDHVDLEAARRLGVRVCNVTYAPEGVAGYTIMLMLMCLRSMPYIMQTAALQDFSLRGKIGRDLSGCTVGVVGTGNIGATVVKRLNGFGCRVLAYDVRPRSDVQAEYVPLEQLWRESDIITLHAPATEQNYHLIGEDSIALMKDGVCIVNTARGKLVDEDALIRGLHAGKIGSCALDVMEDETGLYYADLKGKVIDHPHMAQLRAFPNVILSPHTAFYTLEAVTSMVECNVCAFAHFEQGEDDPHAIV